MGFEYSSDSSGNQAVSERGGAKCGANGKPSETDLATALTLIATLPLSNEEKAAAIRLLLEERKGI